MSLRSVTLSEVQACLAARHRALGFPPAIEALYQEQTRRFRAAVIRSLTLPSVLIYNAFLAVDWLLLPETFWLSVVLHFALVTPTIVCAGLIIGRAPGLLAREMAAVCLPILMVAQIMFIYAMNHGEAADHYQYLAIGILVYMNTSQRPDMRFACATSAILCAIYLGVLLPSAAPVSVKAIGATMMLNMTYVTLLANRRMERDARFGFLTRLQERLRRESAETEAARDALTGLANRRRLDERMDQVWREPDVVDTPAGVVLIDVDHFKAFNDRYGHPAGDQCLRRVAGAIISELRDEDDLAVRFGGEEFLVLLPQIPLGEAIRIAERIRCAVEGLAIPHEAAANGIVTASFGVMVGPVSSTTAADLIAGADTALYAAKRNGRNQVWPPLPTQDTGRMTGFAPVRHPVRMVG